MNKEDYELLLNHINKFDDVAKTIEEMANTQQKMFSNDKSTENSTSVQPEVSSMVSFTNKTLNKKETKIHMNTSHSNKISVSFTNAECNDIDKEDIVPYASSVLPSSNDVELPNHCNINGRLSKAKIKEIKKHRIAAYSPYIYFNTLSSLPNKYSCDKIAALAVGMSSLLNDSKYSERQKRVTIENLFFSSEIPLKTLHTNDYSIINLYDILRDFIEVDNRFAGQYNIELVFLDVTPSIGQLHGSNSDVGNRQPRVTLSDMRKHIQFEIEEEPHSVRFVYYNPTFIERQNENMMHNASVESERKDLMSSLSVSALTNEFFEDTVEGTSHLAVVSNFRNSIQPMIALMHAAAANNGLFTTVQEVALGDLYKGMRDQQPCGRPGGYIRVWKKTSARFNDSVVVKNVVDNQEVNSFFSPELSSGKVLGSTPGCCDSLSLNTHMSSFIGAMGWAFHLLGGADETRFNYGKGLPISHIIRTLDLPISLFINCDIPLHYMHYLVHKYLELTQNSNLIPSMIPIITRDGQDGTTPSLSISELENICIDIQYINTDEKSPNCIALCQFNANIAHNVIDSQWSTHWAIIAGYNEANQMVKVIDSNPQRFTNSWIISLERLHAAMTNYGMVILTNCTQFKDKQKVSVGIKDTDTNMEIMDRNCISWLDLDDKNPFHYKIPESDETIEQVEILKAHIDLLSLQGVDIMHMSSNTVVLPSVPFPLTVISLALSRIANTLASTKSTFPMFISVDHLIQLLPFDITAILEQNFSIFTIELIIHTFCELSDKLAGKPIVTKVFQPKHRATSGNFSAKEYSFDKCNASNSFTLESNKLNLLSSTNYDSQSYDLFYTEFVGHLLLYFTELSNSVILVFFSDNMNIIGTKHPFGNYGIITHYNQSTEMVTVQDGNPNVCFGTWSIKANTLCESMYQACSAFGMRGYLIFGLDNKAIDVDNSSKDVSHSRQLYANKYTLSQLPSKNMFSMCTIRQIQSISNALAFMGQCYTCEEILYEGYLNIINQQGRRSSQAFAWRDLEVSFNEIIHMNVDVTIKLVNKFLDKRQIQNIFVEKITLADTDWDKVKTDDGLTPLKSESCNRLAKMIMQNIPRNSGISGFSSLLVVHYNAATIHHLENDEISTCIIEAIDPTTHIVTLFETEHTKFGLRWSAPSNPVGNSL